LFFFRRIGTLFKGLPEERSAFRKSLGAGEPVADSSAESAELKYDVFLSAPMAGYAKSKDKEKNFERHNRDVKEAIEKLMVHAGVGEVFYAGQQIKPEKDFELRVVPINANMGGIRSSRYFIMIYPKQVVSSVLVEAGMAYAFGKPSLFLVQD